MTHARQSLTTLLAANIVLIGLAGSRTPAFARAGDLDLDFGTNGGVLDAVGPEANAHAVAIQPDGRIVAAGEASNGANQDFVVVRYDSDGTRDISFGASGVVFTPIGTGDDIGRALALQADGKVVVAGESFNGSDRDLALVRYTASGGVDTGFGSGGKVTTDFDGGDDAATALVLQPDGKLVVAGMATVGGQQVFAVARYNPDGTPDDSFGDAGLVTTPFGTGQAEANAIVIQADGKLVAGGSAQNPTKPADFDFALARYTADGGLDNTFGTGGTVKTSFSSKRDAINALALQADGQLLAAGLASVGTDAFAFARYSPDGTLDVTFRKTGGITYPLSGQANALILQPDGRAVAAGVSTALGPEHFVLARLRSDGNIDKPTFGGTGAVSSGFSSGIDIAAQALALQSDGRLVAVGGFDNGASTAFYLIRYLGDPPYTALSNDDLKCWTQLSKNADKLRQCAINCQVRGVQEPGIFDQLACLNQCRTTYDAAGAKLIAKGTCPACLNVTGQSRVADQTTAHVNGRADALYCEGTIPLSFLYLDEFPVPTANSGVSAITLGPDDNFWFTEKTAGKIGKITPAGVVTEFPLASAAAAPAGIAVGPGDNLWFTEQSANKIGQITPEGGITEYSGPILPAGPTAIVEGSDGNLWFTANSTIGRLNVAFLDASPNFLFTQFPLPGGVGPLGIAAGPDGRLWFAENGSGKIGRLNVVGSLTEFPIPTASSGPHTIVNGPDGALWFTESVGNKIGRIATDGSVTEFNVPTLGSPRGLTLGADDNLWFVQSGTARIGRLTPAGGFSMYDLPNAASEPLGIAPAFDGSLWITQSGSNTIGRIFQLGGGFEPPDGNTLNCESVVAKNLGKLATCVIKCQQKSIKANFKGKTFDVAACETADPLKSCAAKFNSLTNKLLLTTGCPICLGATQQAALRDQYVAALTAAQDDLFCADVP